MYRGLDRSIYVLFFARIINSIGAFVYPFLTLFMTQKLNYSTSEAGRLLMLISLCFVPGSLIGGKIADHFGRKRILLMAHYLSAGCVLLCAVLPDQTYIPYLIMVSEFFSGVVHPTTSAMAGDLSTPENRKATFSLLYLGNNLGYAIGPMLAGLLYRSYPRWLFAGDAITTMISLLLVALFVKESLPSANGKDVQDAPALETAETGSVLRVFLKRPYLLIFMMLLMLTEFIYVQINFSLPLFMGEVFGENGPVLYGSVMSMNAVIVIFGTTLIIALTRKFRSITCLLITAFLYASGFGMLYFVHTYAFVMLSTLIWTTGEILGATNISVYITNHTPNSHRGRVNSVAPIIMGTGNAVGPLLMGAFLEYYPVRYVWLLCAVLGLAAFAGFALMTVYDRKKFARVK